MSHDALSLPVYRAELEKAFEVARAIRDLPLVKRMCFLSKGAILTYKYDPRNYSTRFELLDDWYLSLADDLDSCTYPNCKVIEAIADGQPSNLPNPMKLHKGFQGIIKFLNLPPETDIRKYTEVCVGGEFHNLFELLEDTIAILKKPMFNFLMR